MIKSLWSGQPPLTPITIPGQLERSQQEHQALLNALKEGNVGAVEDIVRTHIWNAGQTLKASLQQTEQ